MSKVSIPLKPIDFDAVDQAVEHQVMQRAIPRQIYPGAGQGPQPVVTPAPVAPAVASPPVGRRSGQRLTLELPDYIVDQIYERARQGKPRATAKSVVIAGLKAIGLVIKDEDLVPDGRRA